MEANDLLLLEQYVGQDAELRDLWEQHQEFERMLQKMESRPFNSPAQVQEIKELKKKKLAGKTRIQSLLDKYRTTEA